MSARWNRGSAAGGAAGGAKTTHTYILGIGASGALLAGAGVALISLVGLVSFDVWPGTPPGAGPQEEAQLNFGGPTVTEPVGGTPLSEAADLLASASPGDTSGGPSFGGSDGPDGDRKPAPDGDRQEPRPTAPAPTIPLIPPTIEPDSRTGTQGTGGGKGSKSLPKGDRPRTEPVDNPVEADPLPNPEKVLPRGKGGSSRDDSGPGPGRRRGRPAPTPSESTQSTPSETGSGSTSPGSRSRRGRGGR